jgi:hypothetical protein
MSVNMVLARRRSRLGVVEEPLLGLALQQVVANLVGDHGLAQTALG